MLSCERGRMRRGRRSSRAAWWESVSLLIRSEDRSDAAALSPSRGWRVLTQAREYIEEHITEPITMADLCRYTGASLSTIEKVFRRELQMPPTVYIRTRRLDAVRRVLVNDESNGEYISQIATDHGFSHLGRFSIAYRALFGMWQLVSITDLIQDERRRPR